MTKVATSTKKRTGTLEPVKDAAGRTYYRGKVRLPDGSRARVEIPEPKCFSEKSSRDFVAYAQEVEDRDGTIYRAKLEAQAARGKTPEGETADAWFGRFHTYQRELGHTDADKKRMRWEKWISPRIGTKPMAAVTRDDVEDIRDALDAAIQLWAREGAGDGKLSGKTAMNVWSALTSSFKAATASKRRDLRILEGKANPCAGVEPPGDRNSRKSRRKTFIYPREAAALLACEAVPFDWRVVYAIALYTYLRPGELRVLTFADVDLEAGVIHVTRAWDYRDGKVKPPKSRNGVRVVPVDPSLAPLLSALAEGQPKSALVAPRLSEFGEDHLAEVFRKHLKAAKVDRPELHASTLTHVQSNFRSCRDSGLTWLALSGIGVDKIMRRAGHDNVQTSMGYVKIAEDLTGDLGAPFAPLPRSLLDHAAGHLEAKPADRLWRRRESNPRPSAYETPALTN